MTGRGGVVSFESGAVPVTPPCAVDEQSEAAHGAYVRLTPFEDIAVLLQPQVPPDFIAFFY
jgi:hypothetical protein